MLYDTAAMAANTTNPKGTVYVAGRIGDEDRVTDFLNRLRIAGFETAVDWTAMSLRKPYLDYPHESIEAAQLMLAAATSADIFVLLWDDTLLGGLIETGAAIAMSQKNPSRRIYIVGAKRQSVFYALETVKMVDSLSDILADLDARQ